MSLNDIVPLDSRYLLTMVTSMYAFESKLVWMPELLNETEMFDFYLSYMEYFQ